MRGVFVFNSITLAQIIVDKWTLRVPFVLGKLIRDFVRFVNIVTSYYVSFTELGV